jgi:hypothetical protein
MATVEVDELLETLDEDLLDDHNGDHLSVGSESRNADGADSSAGMLQTLSAPNANDFPNARLIEELEGRRIRPTGVVHTQSALPRSIHILMQRQMLSHACLIGILLCCRCLHVGFRDQDILTLQRVLDDEFELEKEHLIKQQR